MSEQLHPFDDDRFPDADGGHACCFLCGRKVDPLDPRRGSYTTNARAFDGLPMHLACAEESLTVDPTGLRLSTAFSQAMTQMSEANAKREMGKAYCVGASHH